MKKISIFNPPFPLSSAKSLTWSSLHGSSVGLSITEAIKQSEKPILILAPDNLTVSRLIEEVRFFSDEQINLTSFPDWETLPYDQFSPHHDIISERLSALYHIPLMEKGGIIATISTLMQRLPPLEYLHQNTFILKKGDTFNLELIKQKLILSGYQHVSQVREHGNFCIRGSIIDMFPMGSDVPFRIDLLDDIVDSIRFFSPETQRSLEKLNEIHMLPAKEFPLTEKAIELFRQNWRNEFTGNPLLSPLYQDISEGIPSPGIDYYFPLFFEKTATFFDYLPKDIIVLIVGNFEVKSQEFWEEINARYEQRKHDLIRPILKPSQIFLEPSSIKKYLISRPIIEVKDDLNPSNQFATSSAPSLDVDYKANQPLKALEDFRQKYPGRILFCAESLGRREILLNLFKTINIKPTFFSTWSSFLNSNVTEGITVNNLEAGFTLEEPAITLLTETQLYGKKVMQRRFRKKTTQDPDAFIRDLTELKLNDPVVHIDHGIGLYRGLQTLTIGDQLGEFLTLEYQENAKLYVPVSSLHLISRYSGTQTELIPISKLGTERWHKSKQKAAEKAKDVAVELLELYAKRAMHPVKPFVLDEDAYQAFAAGFPFEETPDQLRAIEQVYADMTSTKPMDRVICGDVGFGKTEVAMRAAFLTIQNSKQVVVLVPTTLLAQQHFKNFQDRFAEIPIQIEVLSRFRTLKEQEKILEKMENGQIDIVIGTHKLIQKNIKFKALGLVIIDEEHRFGVKQKEQLKNLRSSVNILTLTATPIPRTLNMALAGIRDLSVIATPPARRLSINTFIHEYDDKLIKEAIQREIMRGGQVYFLHNDISTIRQKAEELSHLLSEARVSVAHGQMHERELEQIMSAFYHRHTNVLVCSTIIESGIDIPTANTIIINRADKLGIAQLHQLRGRVGRSHHQAYAYLFTPARNLMTKDAIKRLEAIATYDDLGIGFTLATHDLEIRGAGELLGESQSGEIQEVGFTLYMDLLSRAVETLKEGKTSDLEDLESGTVEIDLHITALIPDWYLNDVELRLQFYKQIANAKTSHELDNIQVIMIDRFGLLPEPLKNLFAVNELKLIANNLGIKKIDVNELSGRFEFNKKTSINPELIIRLIQNESNRFRLDGPYCLRFKVTITSTKERIEFVADLLNRLA